MFHSARLQLTLWYVATIMVVSIIFSSVIYRFLIGEVQRFDEQQRIRIQRQLQGYPGPAALIIVDPELLSEVQQRILHNFISLNAGILVVSGVLGYVIAGRTLAPIKNMVEEQNRFISDASHELKTPLTSLKSAFEVYLRDKHQTVIEARSLITESIDEVNKLQSLSESLLQLAQYQKPSGSLSLEPVQLETVVTAVLQTMRPIAKQKHSSIEYLGEEVTVFADKYSLTDLLIILVDNAIKYSPEKSVIRIMSKKAEGTIVLSVIDQGIGMSQHEMEHIFDRFYRADAARSKKTSTGYGLGLAIAKKIVEIHHGSITVKSIEGKGSMFSVRLPYKVPMQIHKTMAFVPKLSVISKRSKSAS